ncbi:MAG TPA: hypothetical protein VLX31_02425 [Streptosporangiaceae bacterium]|nr:hypothetical protein [Streptosporangiaceae bacterium]
MSILSSVPALFWWLFWFLVALLLILLVALVIHHFGGFGLDFHVGYFRFALGVTG